MTRRLLIIDDVPESRAALQGKLAAAGYLVDAVTNVAEAQAILGQRVPDIALVSTALRDPKARLLPKLLSAHGPGMRVPVVLLHAGTAMPVPRADVDAVIRVPAPDNMLLARLRSVLRVRDLEDELRVRSATCREIGLSADSRPFVRQPHVLLVPHDAGGRPLLSGGLTAPSIRVSALNRPDLFQRLPMIGPVDAVLFEADPRSPAGDLHCLSDLRCRAETRHAAIILCLPEGAETEAAMALDMGANDVIIGTQDPGLSEATIRQHLDRQEVRNRMNAQLQNSLRLAATDPLTGLYNRRYALAHLDRLVRGSRDTRRPLAVMIADVDRFKGVNDTLGHDAGDKVLAAVAGIMSDNIRSVDMLCRYGGEEFLIVMPGATVTEASRAAERLRARVAEYQIKLEGQPPARVTLSIGVAVAAGKGDGRKADELIRAADKALYAAKSEGRNRISLGRDAA